MSNQKAVAERYTQGFRAGDLATIAAFLTDDVVWALHGTKIVTGRDAVVAEADSATRASEATGGRGPNHDLVLDRLIEEGDTVVAVGHGSVALGATEPIDFVYSEVFTFTDGLVSRLDTFHVWLGEPPAA